MGRIDILSRKYLNRKAVFADAVNLADYDAEPVITPQMLCEISETENQVIVSGKQEGKLPKEAYIQKFRDVMKQVYRRGGSEYVQST